MTYELWVLHPDRGWERWADGYPSRGKAEARADAIRENCSRSPMKRVPEIEVREAGTVGDPRCSFCGGTDHQEGRCLI